jgi:hypothetical protein
MGEPLTSHLSDTELDAFVQRTSPAPVLIQQDRHLAGCSQCRGRVQQRAGLDATVSWLRTDLAAVLPQDHLSEEAIQAAAMGQAPPEAAEHLSSCPACRAEIDDLRLFIAAQRSPGRPRRTRLWVAAAAVLVAASTAALWNIVRPRGQPELVATLHDSGGVVGVDRAGVLHAPVPLPADYTALVAQAVKTGKLDAPAVAGLARKPEFLLGDSTNPAKFALREPVGETVATPQPEFSWTAIPGATVYRVNIYDENFHKVAASPDLTDTSWTAPGARPNVLLDRDRSRRCARYPRAGAARAGSQVRGVGAGPHGSVEGSRTAIPGRSPSAGSPVRRSRSFLGCAPPSGRASAG